MGVRTLAIRWETFFPPPHPLAMAKSAHARARPRLDRPRDSGTLYKRIVRVLQSEIVSGKHPVGARLPTESALCRRFSVSRHTVREALRHLRESGLVSPRQGSGTTVAAAEPSFYLHPVASVTDLMQYAVSTRYVVSGSRFVVADSKLARRLGCSPGRRWLYTEGLRYAPDGSPPICWTAVYVHAAYAGVRSLIGKKSGPIYTWIEEMYDERVVEVVQTLRAVTVAEALAPKLKVPAGSAALEIERVYKSAKHRIIEVAFNLHPADRFSYSISLRPERS
jgi:DNA-binding GntR family transcriptional regulator